jgi:uncharacterized membrane protein YozB (DUF420 family)
MTGAPQDVPIFPALNAALNATSGVLLFAGWVFARRRNVPAHRTCMILALAVSGAFLASYLWYHAHYGSRPFRGTGWIRPVYFSILLSHTVLAASLVPLVFVTVRRALRDDVARHRRIARITWPIWMYVSVTGVIVYWLLYRLDP